MVKVAVRHESGPLQGLSQEFSDQVQRIVLGREPDSQIRFPADFTVVGRRHAELVWDAGRLEVRVNTDNPVLVNGHRAYDGEEIPDGAVLQLGDGPRLSITYVHASALPVTQQSERKPTADDAVQLRQVGVRTKKLIVGVALLALLSAAAVLLFQDRANTLSGSIAGLEAKIGSAGDRGPFEEAIARASSSVYLLVIRSTAGESPIGTAWVTRDGQLATNAHVAEAVDAAVEEGLQAFARSTTTPTRDLLITGSTLHPAYAAFQAAYERSQPSSTDSAGVEELLDSVGGYDVALLAVETPEELQPPLPIASRDDLRQIRAGMPVAFIGFPMEGLVQKDVEQPTSTSQIASILGTTTFTRKKPLNGDGQLLEHSLPATGGASGSPIINTKGEVIGLLNGVNGVVIGGARLPNAAQVNFGQRADVLLDLLELGPDMDISTMAKQWSQDFENYVKRATGNKEAILEEVLADWQKDEVATSIFAKELELSSTDTVEYQGEMLEGTLIDTGVTAGRYLVTAYSPQRIDIDLVVTSASDEEVNVLAEDFEESRALPAVAVFDRESEGDVRIAVIAFRADQNTDPSGDEGDNSAEAQPAPADIPVKLKIWRLPLATD